LHKKTGTSKSLEKSHVYWQKWLLKNEKNFKLFIFACQKNGFAFAQKSLQKRGAAE
jgi:hypothetical protein